MDTFVSKSKYLAGLQCAKLLWYHFHGKDAFGETDPALQAVFDQGTAIGEMAKRVFPEGIEVEGDYADYDALIRNTNRLLVERRPLFEAAFRFRNGYARADILYPAGRNSWDIIEVKSTITVKEVHLDDLALQRYVFEGAGLTIRKTILMHLNKSYVRRGEVDPEQLFTLSDVTGEVVMRLPRVGQALARMVAVVKHDECPEQDIGPQCAAPYECPLQELCWSVVPEHNVFELSYMGKRGFELYHDGVARITEIPPDYRLTAHQSIQSIAVKTGKPHVDDEGISRFLSSIEYPVHFLDFETFSTAIPLFDGISPYESVPFQFSLHILRFPGAKPEHYFFLAEGTADPRREFINALRRHIARKGSIVAYNAPFEKSQLENLATAFPGNAAWLESLRPRFLDLLSPFRLFHYYHPDQHGSASMKAVVPALTKLSYDSLPIGDGSTASNEYVRVTYGDVTQKERQRVRKALAGYCKLDTLGMLRIVEALERLV